MSAIFDGSRMASAVEAANAITSTYGVTILSINIISAVPADHAPLFLCHPASPGTALTEPQRPEESPIPTTPARHGLASFLPPLPPKCQHESSQPRPSSRSYPLHLSIPPPTVLPQAAPSPQLSPKALPSTPPRPSLWPSADELQIRRVNLTTSPAASVSKSRLSSRRPSADELLMSRANLTTIPAASASFPSRGQLSSQPSPTGSVIATLLASQKFSQLRGRNNADDDEDSDGNWEV